MKRLLIFGLLGILISATGFSQKNEREFFVNRKTTDAPYFNCNSVDWNDTKRIPEKWNGMKTQFNVAKMPTSHQKKQPITANNHKSVKQYLDSIDAGGGYKLIFLYDNNGNSTEWIEYYGDIIAKYELTYDGNGNPTELIYYELDGSDWIVYGKTEWSYDGNGNETKRIGYQWDGNEWIEWLKFERAYDGNGNLIRVISHYWYEDISEWRREKTEYTYDGSGNQIEAIRFDWDGSDWVKYYKTEYTYDSSGNLTEEISYYWDGNDWVDGSWKTKYTYDSSGNLTKIINYYWDGNNWLEGGWKVEYTYDGSGNRIEYIYYSWDWDSNDWIGEYKSEYTYDANGNETVYISYRWDDENNDWKASWKTECTYDLSYSITDLVYPYIEFEFTGMITEAKDYYWDGTDWIEDEWYNIFYWSSREVGIVEMNNNPSLRVYPNPTTGQLTIENGESKIKDVALFDIMGKIQLTTGDSQQEKIVLDISHLSAGIYFVKIFTATGEMVRKVVKE